jgi:hypothetical protein
MTTCLPVAWIKVGKFFKQHVRFLTFLPKKKRALMLIYLKLMNIYYYPQWHVYC